MRADCCLVTCAFIGLGILGAGCAASGPPPTNEDESFGGFGGSESSGGSGGLGSFGGKSGSGGSSSGGCTSHASSHCSDGDVYWYDSCNHKESLKASCAEETCTNGVCTSSTAPCTSHASALCDENDLYWYDSCGQKEELKQDCPTDCSDDQCAGPSTTCTPHGSVKCSNGNLYAYDTCDNQQDLVETCPNGCTDGSGTCGSGTSCTINHHKQCYGGDVYWYDSCNVKQTNKADDCVTGEACQNNGSQDASCVATTTCTTNHHKQCYGGDVYWFDSCNVKQTNKADDCVAGETCQNAGTQDASCVATTACTVTNSKASYICHNGDIWFKDNCGNWSSLKSDCANGCSPGATACSSTPCTCSGKCGQSLSSACGSCYCGTDFYECDSGNYDCCADAAASCQ